MTVEVSYDVDGRYVRLEHIVVTKDEHVTHVVYVLTEHPEEVPADADDG